MITDALLDLLSAPANWLLGLLPAATFDPTQFPDPASTLSGIQASQSVLTGGPGFIFNGGLIAAMLASWLAVEAAIFTVRGLVWIKKAILF